MAIAAAKLKYFNGIAAEQRGRHSKDNTRGQKPSGST
jgi:hypothetical protein